MRMLASVPPGRAVMALVVAMACGACGLGLVGSGDRPAEESPSDASEPNTTPLDAAADPSANDAGGPNLVAEDADADASAPPPLVLRLAFNAAADYTGIDYPGVWKASPVPSGGCGPSAYKAEAPLHVADAPLFEGEVYGNPMTCALGSMLAQGTYRVTLYFAEIYFGPKCPGGGGKGSRVFDVYLEGQKMISNLDVFTVSGGCLADSNSDAGLPIVRSIDVPITDGVLDITMIASADNGMLSALELYGPL